MSGAKEIRGFRLCSNRVGMALSADWVRPSRLNLMLDGAGMGVKFARSPLESHAQPDGEGA